MSKIILKNITKSFGKVEILHGIDLEISNNEFTVFVGPSGCGKSTLLRLIAGLEDVTTGNIFIGDTDVTSLAPAKRGVAMVFQSYALYPHMTVYENIAFGLKRTKYAKDVIHQRVMEAADILQIESLLDRKPKQLSGGQRQRVAIGRAIVRDPKAFLFDEPLSNLDASLRIRMRMEIAKLKSKLHTTTIYVTHDQVEAMTLADKIVVLQGGLVEQVGTPMNLYHHPRNKFVAGFIGSPKMNFVEVTISKIENSIVTLSMPNNATLKLPVAIPESMGKIEAGSKAELGIRPEHLQSCTGNSALFTGQVAMVEHLGSETYLYINVDEKQQVLLRVDRESTAKVGDTISVTASPRDCHLFHPESGLSFERHSVESAAG